MTQRRCFISYARADGDMVEKLATELDQLDQDTWRDKHLSGGQQWWSEILTQIRQGDYTVFALSEASVQSKACLSEVTYAHALGKPILPVLVGAPVPDALLPPFVAQTQRVDGRKLGESEVTRDLARAILRIPPAPPLPEPMPDPPELPISFMDRLARRVEAADLDLKEQRNLVADLKQHLQLADDRDAASALLRRLRARPDVYRAVADEIDTSLASSAGSASVAKPKWDQAAASVGAKLVTSVLPSWQQKTPPSSAGPNSSATPAAVPSVSVSAKRRWPWILALVVVTFILLSVLSAVGEFFGPSGVCVDEFGNQFPC